MPRKAIKKYLNCQMGDGCAVFCLIQAFVKTRSRDPSTLSLYHRTSSPPSALYSARVGQENLCILSSTLHFVSFAISLCFSWVRLSCVIVYVSITVKWPTPQQRGGRSETGGNRRAIGWWAVRIDWLNCHFMKFVSLLRCAWKSWARQGLCEESW